MRVGDKVRVRISDGMEGVVSAVFPADGDANIRVRTESPAGNISWGDFYEEELEEI